MEKCTCKKNCANWKIIIENEHSNFVKLFFKKTIQTKWLFRFFLIYEKLFLYKIENTLIAAQTSIKY